MRYFTHNFVELEELPSDVSFLVRAEGTKYVEQISGALRSCNVPYIAGATRKDEVNFFVEKDERNNIEKMIREYLSKNSK